LDAGLDRHRLFKKSAGNVSPGSGEKSLHLIAADIALDQNRMILVKGDDITDCQGGKNRTGGRVF